MAWRPTFGVVRARVTDVSVSGARRGTYYALCPRVGGRLSAISPNGLLFHFSVGVGLCLSSAYLSAFVPDLAFFRWVVSPLERMVVGPTFMFTRDDVFLV